MIELLRRQYARVEIVDEYKTSQVNIACTAFQDHQGVRTCMPWLTYRVQYAACC
jgi:hypothetical protein